MIHTALAPRRARHLVVLALVSIVFVSTAACSSDDEDTNDPAPACKDLCTSAGFSDSRVEAYPHEVNCFCTGGSGTVSAPACSNMCSGLGKQKAEPFGSGGSGPNACQCS